MIRSPAHSRIPFGGKAAALMLALAAASTAAAAQTSANLALTSDYVWRGSTQSHGDPAHGSFGHLKHFRQIRIVEQFVHGYLGGGQKHGTLPACRVAAKLDTPKACEAQPMKKQGTEKSPG